MFFNDIGTSQGLCQDARFLLGFSVNDSITYPVSDLLRNINAWYRQTNSWIWQASSSWEYDDKNYTTLPIATATLVANQQDYELPSSAQKIMRVEVEDNNGNWTSLKQFDQSEVPTIALTEYYEDAGLPAYYDIMGNSLFLYPKPATANVTLTNGLRIYTSRDIDQFTTTSGSREPGFTQNFHRILSYGAALDYAQANNMQERIPTLQARLTELIQALQNFYGKRNSGEPRKLNPADEGAWRI